MLCFMVLGILFTLVIVLMFVGAVMKAWYDVDTKRKLNRELRAKRRER